jgi:hypothetical protein
VSAGVVDHQDDAVEVATLDVVGEPGRAGRIGLRGGELQRGADRVAVGVHGQHGRARGEEKRTPSRYR